MGNKVKNPSRAYGPGNQMKKTKAEEARELLGTTIIAHVPVSRNDAVSAIASENFVFVEGYQLEYEIESVVFGVDGTTAYPSAP